MRSQFLFARPGEQLVPAQRQTLKLSNEFLGLAGQLSAGRLGLAGRCRPRLEVARLRAGRRREWFSGPAASVERKPPRPQLTSTTPEKYRQNTFHPGMNRSNAQW